MDIFRGRYRQGLDKAVPIPANKVERYRFALPNADHVFLPGHRIMVQIQSSWFPLYDRNPQTFVPNIFYAKPGDYRKATQRIYHAPGMETRDRVAGGEEINLQPPGCIFKLQLLCCMCVVKMPSEVRRYSF